MNDEIDRRLERRLRALDAAIPTEPETSERAGALTRLTKAAVAPRGISGAWTLAAGFVVVGVLALSTLFVRGASSPGAASPSPTQSQYAVVPPASGSEEPSIEPTAPATPSPVPTLPPSPTPASPAPPSPSTPPGAVCGGSTHLDRTAPGYESVQLTDVRVGTHDGYDRIVFEFAGSGIPAVDISPASPPFAFDGSGLPLDVPGSAFLKVVLTPATGYPTYTGATTFAPGYSQLVSLVRAGDFEGYLTWIAGLRADSCYRVTVMTAPSRVVIDVLA